MMVKVHIALDRGIRESPEALDAILARIREISSISEINMPRTLRHGIVSGDVSDAFVDRLRGLAGVASVSVDQPRYATGPSAGPR